MTDQVDEGRLETWAAAVTRRGLGGPALFLLEAAQPLRYLLQQACWLAQPLLGERVTLWAALLEDEQALAGLQERIRAEAGLWQSQVKRPGAGSGSASVGRVE